MEKVKKSNMDFPWKLVWDKESKDVLLLRKIKGEFETINELFECNSKKDAIFKIDELGLKYNTLVEKW